MEVIVKYEKVIAKIEIKWKSKWNDSEEKSMEKNLWKQKDKRRKIKKKIVWWKLKKIIEVMDTTEDDVEISDQERIFHGSVRENVVSFFIYI